MEQTAQGGEGRREGAAGTGTLPWSRWCPCMLDAASPSGGSGCPIPGGGAMSLLSCRPQGFRGLLLHRSRKRGMCFQQAPGNPCALPQRGDGISNRVQPDAWCCPFLWEPQPRSLAEWGGFPVLPLCLAKTVAIVCPHQCLKSLPGSPLPPQKATGGQQKPRLCRHHGGL